MSSSSEEELVEKRAEVEYGVSMCSLAILRYLSDNLPRLGLGLMGRLLSSNDTIMALLPLVDNPPWVRRRGSKQEKFVGNKWVVVEPGERLRLTQQDAQVGLCVWWVGGGGQHCQVTCRHACLCVGWGLAVPEIKGGGEGRPGGALLGGLPAGHVWYACGGYAEAKHGPRRGMSSLNGFQENLPFLSGIQQEPLRRAASRLPPGCLQAAPRLPPGCPQAASRLPPGCRQGASRVPPGRVAIISLIES